MELSSISTALFTKENGGIIVVICSALLGVLKRIKIRARIKGEFSIN